MAFWKNGALDKMSFGFEAELLVSFPYGAYPKDHWLDSEQRPSLYQSVVETLKAAGLKADLESPSYKEWQVTFDVSVKEPRPSLDGPETGGVEVISPVFLKRDMGSAKSEIRRVFQALKDFGPLSSNITCGLHVHVGSTDGPVRGAFEMVKNLALLLVAFEHLFNSLIPDSRLEGFGNMSYPPSRVRGNYLGGLTLPDHLILIMQSTRLEQLVHAMNPQDRYGQTNMRYLLPGQGKKPPTIEFRHFPGTTDPELVVHYAELWLALVSFAHGARPAELDALLHRAYDPQFTVFDLLGAIGARHLRGPFLGLWKPLTRARKVEPPWHPRWWEPAAVARSARALERGGKRGSSDNGLDSSDSGFELISGELDDDAA